MDRSEITVLNENTMSQTKPSLVTDSGNETTVGFSFVVGEATPLTPKAQQRASGTILSLTCQWQIPRQQQEYFSFFIHSLLEHL